MNQETMHLLSGLFVYLGVDLDYKYMHVKDKEPLSYLKHLENVHFREREIDVDKVTGILNSIESLSRAFFYSAPSFFILDYTRREYIKLSNYGALSMGYRSRDFIDGGLDFILDIYQKDDFACMNHNIFTHVVEFLKSKPQEDHDKYLFTHNYRWKKKDGTFATILQKRSFITSPVTGLPLISFGSCLDVSSFNHDHKMVHVIDKMTGRDNNIILENITTDFFFPDAEETLLTKREKEILYWMADGLSSKQMADKLFIAENTIANHRKNILQKTNSKNVAELIRYAINNGII